jgi:hypothetical protein
LEWTYFFLGVAVALGLAALLQTQKKKPDYLLNTVADLSHRVLDKFKDEHDYLESFMEFQQRQTEALEEIMVAVQGIEGSLPDLPLGDKSGK